jgi:hypothetical protein
VPSHCVDSAPLNAAIDSFDRVPPHKAINGGSYLKNGARHEQTSCYRLLLFSYWKNQQNYLTTFRLFPTTAYSEQYNTKS